MLKNEHKRKNIDSGYFLILSVFFKNFITKGFQQVREINAKLKLQLNEQQACNNS